MTWLAGLVPVAMLAAFVLTEVREQQETDIAQRVESALDAAGQQWAIISVKGRDVKIGGVAFDEAERDSATSLVRELSGVREISDRVDLQSASAAYSWRVTYKSNRIRIKGLVPSSDDRRTILGFLKASLPDAEIDDRMKLAAGGPARELWLGAVSFGLTQLGRMKSGSIRLDGTQLMIAGEAKTSPDYELIRNSLGSAPVGVQLLNQNITPPRIKPFTWAGQFDGNTLTLTGYVQNDSERETVIKSTRQKFVGKEVTDRMEIAIGAPGAWPQAISVALAQLARVESGRVSISENEVVFSAVIGNESLGNAVRAALKSQLPPDYKLRATVQGPGSSQADGRSGSTQTGAALRFIAGMLSGPVNAK